MKKSRFSDEQIADALREFEAGTPVAEITRKLGVSEATFYAWKQKFGSIGAAEIRELRQLREGNANINRWRFFSGIILVIALSSLILVLVFLVRKARFEQPFFLLPTNISHERPPLGANSIVITPQTTRSLNTDKGKTKSRPITQIGWKITQDGGNVEERSLSPADDIAVYALYLVAFSSLTGLVLLIIGFQSLKESQIQGKDQAIRLNTQSKALQEQAVSLEKQIGAMEKHHADEFAPVINILPGEVVIRPGDEDTKWNIDGEVNLKIVNGGRGASIKTGLIIQFGGFSSGFVDVGIITSDKSWIGKELPVTWISPEGAENKAKWFLKLHDALVQEPTKIGECLQSRKTEDFSEEDKKNSRSLRIVVTYDNILNAYESAEGARMYESSIEFDLDQKVWSPVVLRKLPPKPQKSLREDMAS